MTEEDKADVKQRVPRSSKQNIIIFPLAISKDVNDSDVTCVEKKKKGYHVGYYFVSLTKKTDPFLGKARIYGYKSYTHERPKNLDGLNYIFYAWYKGYLQDGIKINQKSFKSLLVYYFTHDTSNTTPLFIRLNPKGGGYYEPTSNNKWRNIDQVEDSELYNKFMKIVNEASVYPVVINLTERNKYYIDGYREDKYLARSKVPRISVTSHDSPHKEYKMNTHRIYSQVDSSRKSQLKDMRVVSTISGRYLYEFESTGISSKSYSCVSVYYWELIPETILLLQLGEDEFFVIEQGSWKKDQSINLTNLFNNLEKQNCLRNRAHVINISIRGIHYYCCICSEKIISEENENNEYKYSKCTHTLNNDNFSTHIFEDGTTVQDGLPSARDVSQVCVYYYVRSPFLIKISSECTVDRWFIKTGKDEWNESHEDLKSEHETVSKILGTMLYSLVDNSEYDVSYSGNQTSESQQGKVEFVEYLTSSENGPYSVRASGTSILELFPHTGAQISGTRANSGSTNRVAIVVGGVSGSIIALLGGLETLAFFKYPSKSVIRSIVGMFNKSLDYKPLEQLNGLIFLGTQNSGTSAAHLYQNIPKNVV